MERARSADSFAFLSRGTHGVGVAGDEQAAVHVEVLRLVHLGHDGLVGGFQLGPLGLVDRRAVGGEVHVLVRDRQCPGSQRLVHESARVAHVEQHLHHRGLVGGLPGDREPLAGRRALVALLRLADHLPLVAIDGQLRFQLPRGPRHLELEDVAIEEQVLALITDADLGVDHRVHAHAARPRLARAPHQGQRAAVVRAADRAVADGEDLRLPRADRRHARRHLGPGLVAGEVEHHVGHLGQRLDGDRGFLAHGDAGHHGA